MIRRIAVSFGLAFSLLISAVVELNRTTKHYATFAFAFAIFLYWSVELLISYIQFRKTYDSKYQFYKAKLVNSSNLNIETIENNNKKYYKRFKLTMLKESLLRLAGFFGSLGFAITILVVIII